MRKSARGAFTLVELLVVITIIGMLMAMIFPALGSFLARVDQTRCENNQKEIAQAVGLYVTGKGLYPGYSSRILMSGDESGRSRQPVLKSWIVSVMEMINKENFDAIRKNLPSQPVQLKMFNCPANSREGDLIGYVANCGRQDAASAGGSVPPDWKANGVFMKQSLQSGGGMTDEKVKATDIVDGESTTLLISENMQATRWTLYDEPDIGMIWYADGSSPNAPQEDSALINAHRDVEVSKGEYKYARPSSNHAGGVVVAFCDARTMFISDRVDYGGVYCKLMTPNGKEAKEPGQKKLSNEFFRQPFNAQLLEQ
ncbi:MAG: DUF1559 domain-containing protein [Pirellulales bacterium]